MIECFYVLNKMYINDKVTNSTVTSKVLPYISYIGLKISKVF